MKQSDIQLGADYGYQRNRVRGSIQRATVKGFTSSLRGAPLVEIDIHETRYVYKYDQEGRAIKDSGHQALTLTRREVPLSTIVGPYDQVIAEQLEKAEANRVLTEQWEAERIKAAEYDRNVFQPALIQLTKVIEEVTGRSYVHGNDKLNSFKLEQVQALTEALRKAVN